MESKNHTSKVADMVTLESKGLKHTIKKDYEVSSKSLDSKHSKIYLGDTTDNALQILADTMAIVSSILTNIPTGVSLGTGNPPANFAKYPPLLVKLKLQEVKLKKMIK